MKSTDLPDAREGSPTAPRGAPEAWWASAAPRPFGGSQSGGGLPPREADRETRKILLRCRLSNLLLVDLVEAVKCVAAPSPVCPGSRAPSSVPRPVPRRTARGPLGPRRGQRRRPRRRRSPARTTTHDTAAHRPALTLPPRHG